MRGLEVVSHPIFFDYSAAEPALPFGRVDLKSTTISPWVYACGQSNPNFATCNLVSKFCAQDGIQLGSLCSDSSTVNILHEYIPPINNEEVTHSILKQGQGYFIEVVLTLPESEVNKKLGMFMLTVDLRSSDGSLLAKSKQSSLFPYESGLVGLTRKIIMLLPLVTGVIAETKTLSMLCFDNYADTNNDKSFSYAEVSLEVPHVASYPATAHTIQILSAEFHYGRMMSPLQRFFRSWFYFCAFIGTLLIFVCYGVGALHVASRRGWLLNRQAYGAFGDIFNSENDSTYYDGSQIHSLSGLDVEFLNEEDEDDDAWEPIGVTDTEDVNKSNIVPDDNSAASKNDTQQLPNNESDAMFPLGTLSQNPNVQNHKAMFSSNDGTQSNAPSDIRKTSSAQEEEKCLADMVVKGLSKFEVFTGEK
jgi:hypothetical protein